MELDAAVWGKLPFDMVERVLSFLPVPDLCRLRTVSKESNELICKRQFGATHGHNALQRRDASSFIVVSCMHIFWSAEYGELSHENTHQTWCFFDLEARGWYTLKANSRALELFGTIYPPTLLSGKPAMDGGLVCQFYKTQAHPGFSIIVFNPIAGTLREISSPPAHVVPEFAELNLVVDSAAQQFKVLLINYRIRGPSFQANHGGRYIGVCLGEYFRFGYKRMAQLEQPPRPPFPEWEEISVSIVMFQGLVHACFPQSSEDFDTDIYRGIWRCSPVEIGWERVHVDPYNLAILIMWIVALLKKCASLLPSSS